MLRDCLRVGCVVGLWAGIVAQFLTAYWFHVQVSIMELLIEIPFVTLIAVGAIVLTEKRPPGGDKGI